MTAEQLNSIRTKAELLAGQAFGADGDAIVTMACERACAACNRSDIPPDMEQAVAALAAAIVSGGNVKALKRGDTSLTFTASGAEDVSALLSPWRRLGTVKEDA